MATEDAFAQEYLGTRQEVTHPCYIKWTMVLCPRESMLEKAYKNTTLEKVLKSNALGLEHVRKMEAAFAETDPAEAPNPKRYESFKEGIDKTSLFLRTFYLWRECWWRHRSDRDLSGEAKWANAAALRRAKDRLMPLFDQWQKYPEEAGFWHVTHRYGKPKIVPNDTFPTWYVPENVTMESTTAKMECTTAGGGPLAWPEITKECRPWFYWHCMGSAVNKHELTRHLEMYSKAGIGGVHMIAIYGVKGYEDRYIDFLSPKWMEMLAHAAAEADRVGMGLDMTPGTGWNFGGPQVSEKDANAYVNVKTYKLEAGGRLGEKLAKDKVQALVAYSDEGKIVDLMDKIGDDGTVDWTAPGGKWELYSVSQELVKRMVKRAAPGGEGYMLNPFSNRAMKNYLVRFNKAFADYRGAMPRAFYHDSYEYRTNWVDNMFQQFETRRGYRLQEHLPAFFGKGPAAVVSRVRCDYRRTIDDILLEEYIVPWVKWSHDKGCLTRNQAHGSPGNILDLYAAVDIPETETYGPAWIRMAGQEIPPGVPKNLGGGPPDIMANKMASSASHVAGKQLTSCEAATWLCEHFHVSLAHVKGQMDLLFTAGINHVISHGITFSPEDAPWPGWLFYAATNFAPSNTFWHDFPALNAYIARCQSFLQSGRPDNDVLAYLPIHDLWSKEDGTNHMLHLMQVHNSHVWLRHNMALLDRAARMMWDRGYGMDFVSDRMLKNNVSAAEGRLEATGGSYRVLVVAGCKIIPVDTLQRIVDLARDGATVIVVGKFPSDVPGLHDLENRRKHLKEILATIDKMEIVQPDVRQAKIGKGRVLVGGNLETMLTLAGVRRETVVDHGIKFIRRITDEGRVYFMTN
ncbi:MAG: hypothetical protein K8R46_09265, partial [Pirellulales bacterium]|nr:hypothetical protein [Pirellulales bacterium]